MNVLIIPEDFRKDQFILKPIIEALLRHIGQSSAKVQVCQDLVGGVDQALNQEKIGEIIQLHPMTDLFLLIVDRDGVPGRRQQLDRIERETGADLAADQHLLAENAWQEVEVWVLAGHSDWPSAWQWAEVRAEPNPKERYFSEFVRMKGASGPGGGRRQLAREAAMHCDRIRQLCQEDVEALEMRAAALKP